jgi:hypothetical protein
LVVVAIIALLISILPSLSRARELSKRLVCAANAKGIGTSCKIYSNENEELYPVAEHNTDIAVEKVYFDLPNTANADPTGTSPQGRALVSNNTTTHMSTTRAFWMLIRTGDNTPKQYICPSSGDSTDPTDEIDIYYDFLNISHVSYGYQVPYGPSSTRPSEGLDTRMVLAADKGPYASGINGALPSDAVVTEASPPNEWKPFNSSNHGGRGAGEGQNCLYADAHATFERKPIVGVDNDNIYTVMTNNALIAGRLYGDNPRQGFNPYPGRDTFGTDAYASTDTLIYP